MANNIDQTVYKRSASFEGGVPFAWLDRHNHSIHIQRGSFEESLQSYRKRTNEATLI